MPALRGRASALRRTPCSPGTDEPAFARRAGALMRRLVVLSGGVGSGKSSLAQALRDLRDAYVVNTRDLIVALQPDVERSRGALQQAGDALDAEFAAAWVADGLATLNPVEEFVVLDAARRAEQIEAIRARHPDVAITHLHLRASEAVMAQRYATRAREGDESLDYAGVRRNATEAAIEKLAETCDVVVDTSTDPPETIAVHVLADLGA